MAVITCAVYAVCLGRLDMSVMYSYLLAARCIQFVSQLYKWLAKNNYYLYLLTA